MKLIQEKPKRAGTDQVRERALENVKAELFRLTQAVDELKVHGSIDDLDAAQKVLWAALLVVDGLLGRK